MPMALIGYSSRSPGFSPGGSVLFRTLLEVDCEAKRLGPPVCGRGFASGGSWWSRGQLRSQRPISLLGIDSRPTVD